ncbi:hypothetical protein FNV43_RR08230 [Rhamnella rubrinervis]|uniref:Ubiquitin-like protease family profile domain-containing protein n=1 Tax=Rhamnella rubrinervis TaxID=2594499 RepID=A0A8K0HHE8_9ROSA|nr:hypothetical protein FNV43_RR08230 [Rhamnella rubrinervis]
MDWEVFLNQIVQFCGGFIYHLLLHQVECKDKYVMEFDFNGIGARFDRKCFTMRMGLNYGKFPHDTELEHLPYDLWTKFFGKRGPMTQGEFSKTFEDLDFDEKEVADNVKYYMFYFLETVYLAGTRRDWVKRGYEIVNYSVSRFPLAFQIWGFETIPIVTTIGPHGKYHGSNWIPRMVAWLCPFILQYTKLATAIFDRKDPLSNIPAVPIWDPFTSIDPAEKAALSAFIDDPSTTVHSGDHDALEKSLFELILTCGSWFGNGCHIVLHQEEDDKFSLNVRSEQSEHSAGDGEDDALTDTDDWEKEMKDSPFDMYALGTLLFGSKSWLKVYVPVNNDNKHWLTVKVDIQNRTVTLYDPDNTMSQDSFQCRNVKCLSVLLSYLLMVYGYYNLYPELKVEGNSNLKPFDIKRELATNVSQ